MFNMFKRMYKFIFRYYISAWLATHIVGFAILGFKQNQWTFQFIYVGGGQAEWVIKIST